MSASDHATQALAQLAALWQAERDTTRLLRRKERLQLSLAQRAERGIALRDLVVDETDAIVGGRALLWLKPRDQDKFGDLRFGVGEPVRLWSGEPEGELVQQGIVARVGRGRLGIAVDADYAEFLDHGAFQLDREAPEITFERGARAIARLRDAPKQSDAAVVRELLFGDAEPVHTRQEAPLHDADFLDRGLNESQRSAVQFALDAHTLALIHGPPGTGKTRTLVEIVRQALRRGERVLVTAASNTAVDNLAERLIEAGVPLLRLGHPARVAPAVEGSTLDARVEHSEARKLAKRWTADANELRRRVERRRARGTLDYREGRELLAEARRLMREARGQLELARELAFAEAKVVCATAAGADAKVLADQVFDRVVLDEATQAVDPVALCALLQARCAVLAGDPRQLPPTVIDEDAARQGLGTTFFERLAQRHGQGVLRMLDVQYRMHEDLMRFPSQSMYEGKLCAAPEVAARLLTGLPGVAADDSRVGPLIFLDTCGKGWSEEQSEDDPSTKNPGQAERVAAEVHRLLSRGLAPQQLAVITPYDAQARLLRESLRAEVEAGLEIGTVDGFQGREKEAILVDLVRSNESGEVGFLRDARRMNVALTRAKRFLMVVGDSATLGHVDYYRRFMDAADALGAVRSAWEDDPT
ncbi:MAG TPA: AAA domain-containing protein [Polyangiales bacterium]